MHPRLLLAACLVWAMPATANELPKRKPGLWEIKMAVAGRDIPLRNIQQCTDAETDAVMTAHLTGMAGDKCDKPKIDNSDGTITINATCKIGASRKTTRAVIAGDFDSAYTITVTSLRNGTPAVAAGEPQVTMQAKWVGPCKNGQRPGDVILPGGLKINVRSLAIN